MIFPSWLESESKRLEALADHDKLPHALLCHGAFGVGRRLLALRLADRLLGSEFATADPAVLDDGRIDGEQLTAHPDFMLVQPEENKNKPGEYRKNISVEQVREVIEFLSLTSLRGGAKVVIVTPAQLLSESAANALLKTLEEPIPGNYMILLCESLASLPATIVSRCQRVRVPVPAEQDALSWLEKQQPGPDWPSALHISAGAPMAALDWQRLDFPALAVQFDADLVALRQRRDSPAGVASRWVKADAESCLRWLYLRLSTEIRSQIGANPLVNEQKSQIDRLQSDAEVLNMEPDFARLRQIAELRRLKGAGLNMELQLTGLLQRWYGLDAPS